MAASLSIASLETADGAGSNESKTESRCESFEEGIPPFATGLAGGARTVAATETASILSRF